MARFAQVAAAAAAAVAALAPRAALAAGDAAVLAGEVGRLNNQSLLWGPYKPNLYLGVRPRAPEGLWSALMWSRIDSYEDVKKGFRLTCEQGEDIRGYGWDEYDARTGGVQTIHDEGNGIDLTTSFVKLPGGTHGGSWAVRVKGELRKGAPETQKTTLYYYFAQDGEGELRVEGTGTKFGFEGDVTLAGSSKLLGEYSIVVTEGQGAHPTADNDLTATRRADTTVVTSQQYEDHLLWQAKPIVFQQLQKAAQHVADMYGEYKAPPPWQVYRVDHSPGRGNAHIIQKTFEGPFEFDVIFSSASAGKAPLTSAELGAEIKRNSEAFSERFSRVFELKAPFQGERYQAFGKSLFSNLLGGVGYFYGEQLVDRSYAPEYDEDGDSFWVDTAEARARGAQRMEGPYELLTSIPSRPFFPRGFLWDEGYHLMPIADWDADLALEIIKSWYATMDDDGWIPREQILGGEARSKVPEEFQVQYPHYANPPTLFLAIESFTERLLKRNGSGAAERETLSGGADGLYRAHLDKAELGSAYLRSIYPLLRRQYDWFRRTQRGDIKSYDREAYSTREAYRWRGRSETHCLTSGLDDYPRPQPPHPGELHVDLLSWVGLMAKSLATVADALGMGEEVAELRGHVDGIEHNLHDLHWSEAEGCFCDATVDEYEEHRLVCHKGYVSLFPFLVGLLGPDDAKLGRMLDLLGDEEELWSAHGIRSLSRRDAHYGTGENYWRSPVWMPMNYMAATQLHSIATQGGPFGGKARDLYRRLRRNLVDTVYASWAETGFAWEQYNPETGAGQRTQHFTGWTSLAVKLMAMEDLGGEGEGEGEGGPSGGRDEL